MLKKKRVLQFILLWYVFLFLDVNKNSMHTPLICNQTLIQIHVMVNIRDVLTIGKSSKTQRKIFLAAFCRKFIIFFLILFNISSLILLILHLHCLIDQLDSFSAVKKGKIKVLHFYDNLYSPYLSTRGSREN